MFWYALGNYNVALLCKQVNVSDSLSCHHVQGHLDRAIGMDVPDCLQNGMHPHHLQLCPTLALFVFLTRHCICLYTLFNNDEQLTAGAQQLQSILR